MSSSGSGEKTTSDDTGGRLRHSKDDGWKWEYFEKEFGAMYFEKEHWFVQNSKAPKKDYKIEVDSKENIRWHK